MQFFNSNSNGDTTVPVSTPESQKKDHIEVKVGKAFDAHPIPIPKFNGSDPLGWNWNIPGFDLASVVAVSAFVFGILAVILLGLFFNRYLSVNRNITVAFGIFFFVIAAMLTWFRVNIAKNQSFREAACVALSKSNEAQWLWSTSPGPGYMAKDTYFEAKPFSGPVLRVLRDGTIEKIGFAEAEVMNVEQDVKADHGE